MKKTLLFLALALMINAYCADKGYKDYLPRLKEIFGDDMPYKPTTDKNVVRETKFPGETYTHIFNSNTTGSGKTISNNRFWFNTGKTFRFHNQINVVFEEKITSTDEDLDQGIIKSEFTVQKFSEFMGNVNGKVDIGFIGSDKVTQALLKAGEICGKELKIMGQNAICLGITAGSATVLIPGPAKIVGPVSGTTAAAIGATLYGIGWFTSDYLPEKTTKDGFYTLDPGFVKKQYPTYKEMVEKIRHLEGSTVRATWVVGKGYTEIKIKAAADNVKEKDCEDLAKMIYRMNPVGARSIIPAGNENKRLLTVKAADIGGMVLPAGFNYNTLSGSIKLRNRGKTEMEYPDEKANERSKTPIRTLSIADDLGSRITFRKKFIDGSSLVLNVDPKGKFEVATDEDNKDGAPIYVRHVELEGDVYGEMDKPEDGFWSDMEIEKSSLEMKCEYNQLRATPFKTNKEKTK